MNWYYVDDGKQAGPVDEAQLTELRNKGTVQPDTLVWREGMANWQPYSQVFASGSAGGVALAPAGQAVCAECGQLFDLQNMIAYGNLHVCAQCKPIFVQKLAEGAQLQTGPLNYAGFWIRFGAVFLDWVIMWIANMVVAVIAGLSFGQALGIQPREFDVRFAVIFLVQMSIPLLYEVIMIGKYGATVGKMACNIKVVTAEGGKVSYLRSIGRYFAKFLSALICLIGYIMAAFDDEKRALHDRICNTRVVLK